MAKAVKGKMEPAGSTVVVNQKLLAACELVLNRRPICGTANDISLAEGDLEIITQAVNDAKKLPANVPGVVYLVLAQWEFEGNSDLAAFRDRAAAEAFVERCESHQAQEPDDDENGTEWENAHPGKPYLPVGDTLRGVESFVVIEITVL